MILDGLISVAVALVFLFVTESVLRVLYPEKVLEIARQRLKVQNLAYQFHPQNLIDLKPNIKKTFIQSEANGGDKVQWKTNQDGFRGNDLNPHAKTRVMVYGDSNVQARFSPIGKSFTGRLEQYLNGTSKKDVEVVNAGVVGFGPDQNLKKFMAGIDRYQPDIVIFHIFADNDFGDIIRNRLFEIGPDGALAETGLKLSVDPSLKGTGSRLLITQAATKILGRLGIGPTASHSSFEDTSTLTAMTKEIATNVKLRTTLINREFDVYKKRQRRRFSHFADHYDIDVALNPENESSVTKIALMEAILKKAANTAATNDVKLVVLIQPSTRDLTRNMQPNYEDFGKYPSYRPDRLTSTIDKICDRNTIHRINLFPVFLSNNPQSLYFTTNDDHWNEKGQDLAAHTTAQYLHQHFDETLPDPS